MSLTPAGAWAQFPTIREGHQLRLLGVRGYHHPEGNENGVYDDLIVVCDGPEKCENFRASVDPGRYYLQHPMKPEGCARLLPGLYWYRVGIHRGQNVALIQDAPVDVERLDPEGHTNVIENGVWIGANIHSGGSDEEVGRWSAGCQVIHSPEGAWSGTWERFLSLVANSLKEYKQTRIPYYLTDKALNVAPI